MTRLDAAPEAVESCAPVRTRTELSDGRGRCEWLGTVKLRGRIGSESRYGVIQASLLR
jgi:hypothetical protein